MTLAEMRQFAEHVDAMDEDQGGNRLARAVIALLDTSMPCGWDVPKGGRDARGLAVALLRAADEAEAMR